MVLIVVIMVIIVMMVVMIDIKDDYKLHAQAGTCRPGDCFDRGNVGRSMLTMMKRMVVVAVVQMKVIMKLQMMKILKNYFQIKKM